jgi:hypothetical protein
LDKLKIVLNKTMNKLFLLISALIAVACISSVHSAASELVKAHSDAAEKMAKAPLVATAKATQSFVTTTMCVTVLPNPSNANAATLGFTYMNTSTTATFNSALSMPVVSTS